MASKQKTRKKKSTSKRSTQKERMIKNEILIWCSLAVCIFLTVSNFGVCGAVGNALSSFLFGVFGLLAYIAPILIFVGITFVSSNKGNSSAYIKTAASVVMFWVVCTIIHIICHGYMESSDLVSFYKVSSDHRDGGGFLAGCLLSLLVRAIGEVGVWIVMVILVIICLVLITEKSIYGSIKEKAAEGVAHHKEVAIRRREERALEIEKEDASFPTEEMKDIKKKRTDRKVSGVSFQTTLKQPAEDVSLEEFVPDNASPSDLVISRATPQIQTDNDEAGIEEKDVPVKEEDIRTRRRTKESRKETVVAAEHVEQEIVAKEEKPVVKYQFPPLSLLTKGKATGGDSNAYLRQTALKLQQTLQNFGVKVTVTNVSCGPSVTRYELQPEQGVKVSKIVALADDIKLNLAAADIRIEAPIPGKAAVGIEVPNQENSAVMLRDLLESEEFISHKSNIAFAAGRDIAGKVVVADIAKMPHVLIAGATGSGKSVCINTLIMSILYKASPEDVRLIMIDPKVVELKVYNGIPHLLIPVVTDPKKAAGALHWAVTEMTRRYELFANYNVRDINGYNASVQSIAEIEADDKPQKLPQIVIIVDELADLMMVAPGEVEESICRLAQLARAAGIHLVVATQRPSVNVITGLIKANMPSRIAFAVSSGVDSRTIIDMNGAEKLLGKGDMLFYPTGYPKPVRVQGSFVSDKEVQDVVDYLKAHGMDAGR